MRQKNTFDVGPQSVNYVEEDAVLLCCEASYPMGGFVAAQFIAKDPTRTDDRNRSDAVGVAYICRWQVRTAAILDLPVVRARSTFHYHYPYSIRDKLINALRNLRYKMASDTGAADT